MDKTNPLPTEPVPPETPAKSVPCCSPRAKILLLALGAIALVIITSLGTYYITLQSKAPVSSPVPLVQATPTPFNETANWKTYTNDRYGFSFKYPTSWGLKEYFNNLGVSDSMIISGQDVKLKDGFMVNKIAVVIVKKGESTISDSVFVDSCKSSGKNCIEKNIQIDGTPAIERDYFSTTPSGINKTQKLRAITIKLNDLTIFITQERYVENESVFLEPFNQILSTFKFTEQNQAEPSPGQEVRKISFSPQPDVANGGTWRSYASNVGFYMQYPSSFRITVPETLDQNKCHLGFGNDAGGILNVQVVPYSGGSRRELYGVGTGYTYQYEDVLIQNNYRSLIIEAGPIGDSGSGSGIVVPVGNQALIISWSNRAKDSKEFNSLLEGIKINGSLNINNCGK